MTRTVNEPDATVNAQAEPQTQGESQAMLHAANTSWLRSPMLDFALLLLMVFAMKTPELTPGMLANLEPVIELFNIPL
jgi:hypothetical protein